MATALREIDSTKFDARRFFAVRVAKAFTMGAILATLTGCGAVDFFQASFDVGLLATIGEGLSGANGNGTLPAGSTVPGTPPAVVDVTVTTPENTPLTINAPVADQSVVAGLSVAVANNPAHGSATVDASTKSVTYTPADHFVGVDTFTVQVCDASTPPLCGTATVTVIVTPVGPTTTPDTNVITEDATPNTVSGNVLANDSDPLGGSLSVAAINAAANKVGVAVTGTYGSVTVAGDGSYTYTLDNSLAIVQALRSDQTATDVFAYSASNGSATTDSTLTITITGMDDVLTAFPDTASITEDAVPNTVSGNILANDAAAAGQVVVVADVNGNAANVGAAMTTTYGGITINADGSFTYTLDNSNPTVNNLHPGDTLSEAFNYTAHTGALNSASTLTITIQGSNDIPVLTADDVSINEDDVNVSGNVLTNDSDPDNGPSALAVSQVNAAAANVGAAVAGTYGSVTVGADGAFTYTLNNSLPAVQGLGVGESLTDVFAYTATDGADSVDSTLTVTIHGVNDPPVANPDVNGVVKGTVFNITGNVLDNDTDPDTSDVLTVSLVNGGSGNVGNPVISIYGSLTIDSNGVYVYQLNNSSPAVIALAPGVIVTDVFTYEASDGHGDTSDSTLTISIAGGNDIAVGAPDSTSIKEDQLSHVVTGNVLTNDIASTGHGPLVVTQVRGDAANVGVPVSSPFGSLVINSDGGYTYTLDNSAAAVQSLAAGAAVEDVFAYTLSDGSSTAGSTLTVTVKGENDPPDAVDDTYTITIGGTLTITAADGVMANDHDIDVGNTIHAFLNTGPSHATSFMLNTDGSFTYVNDGSSAETDTFTYHVDDQGGSSSNIATVTITIGPGS